MCWAPESAVGERQWWPELGVTHWSVWEMYQMENWGHGEERRRDQGGCPFSGLDSMAQAAGRRYKMGKSF